MKTMIEGATELVEIQANALKSNASKLAQKTFSAALKRLVDLRKINDHVRLEEIEHAQEQLENTLEAIEKARLRLDSIRLIVEGDVASFR